jgi:SAM-dependent methyltransferase
MFLRKSAMALTYNPGVFAVQDIQQAMNIILTPEDSTTERRWTTETAYLADMIGQQVEIDSSTVLLDYGCGIGRIAKELITRHGCSVVGVDISPQMRMLGVAYVQSDRFMACSPEMLNSLLASGLTFHAATSIWVLQHCLDPIDDISLIQAALKPEGRFFVVNNRRRAVPTLEEGWVDDGFDVKSSLSERFELQQEGQLLPAMTTPLVSKHTFWARYRRPADSAP